MKDNNVTISIVTPTYNRKKLLTRCYESLCKQTDQDFEWIIVDDGSSDNTSEVVKSFHPDFQFSFVSKNNGGKHTALNASHSYIHGKYVCILDSDDYLINTAVEQIKNSWKEYENNSEIGIVILLKGASIDRPSCMAFPEDEGKTLDIMRYHRKYIYSADACEVIRADLFRKYPFPIFEGENFISEGALWNRVSFTHKCVYINKVVYIAEYLDGGLTKSGKYLRVHNPNGGMYTANLNMNKKNFIKLRVKNGLLYTCYGFFAKKTILQMFRQCDSKFLMCVCFPAGYVLYNYWKKKYY